MISLLTAFFMAYGDADWYWWALWCVAFVFGTYGRLYIRKV